jgi:hypothetical protein
MDKVRKRVLSIQWKRDSVRERERERDRDEQLLTPRNDDRENHNQ